MLKTRIKVIKTKEWTKYVPQYKVWFWWNDYDPDVVLQWSFGKDYLQWSKDLAEKFIDSRIEYYKRDKSKVTNIRSMKVSYEDYPE